MNQLYSILCWFVLINVSLQPIFKLEHSSAVALLYLVERQAFVAVGYVYDSAVVEAVLFEQVSHDGVVAEGVDAYVAADAEAVVEYGGEGAVSFGQTRNAVDYIIRLVVEP